MKHNEYHQHRTVLQSKYARKTKSNLASKGRNVTNKSGVWAINITEINVLPNLPSCFDMYSQKKLSEDNVDSHIKDILVVSKKCWLATRCSCAI